MINKQILLGVSLFTVVFICIIPFVSSTTYDYLIYTDGVNYYANNGTTNATVYSGTNCTTVINNAIWSLSNGSIYINSGNYYTDGTININISNFILNGAGETAILNHTTNSIGILITGAITNVLVENIKIIGTYSLLPTAYGMVQASYTTYFTIQNCNITGAGFHSIFLIHSDYALITHNEISNSSLDGIALADGSDYCTVSYNNVTYISDMSNYNGIDLNGGVSPTTYNLVINNNITWAHGGICFDQANYNTAQNNIISHIVLGIDLSGAGATMPTIYNNLINNIITYSEGFGGSSAGIQMPNHADYNTLSANIINYFSDGRCVLVGGTSNIIFASNNFTNSILGIEFSQSGNTLTNNIFQNLPIGIELHGTTQTISGNTFINVTSGIYPTPYVPPVLPATYNVYIESGTLITSIYGLNGIVGSSFSCNAVYVNETTLLVSFVTPHDFYSVPNGLTYYTNDSNYNIFINIAVTGNFTIYFTDFTGGYLPITLINLMVLLILILVPVIAFYEAFGKVAVVPALILMTIVCYIAGLIPFFVVVLMIIVYIAILIKGKGFTND